MTDQTVTLSPMAAKRIATVLAGEPGKTLLRVSVEGGGCSGFSYKFDLEAAQQDDDIIVERDGVPTGIVLRAASGSRGRAAVCNLCHTMQPGNQVALFTARRAGDAGERGDSVGTYVCADLGCHENVRLAAPLAPSEVRASVDRRIDGTRRRVEAFVERVVAPE